MLQDQSPAIRLELGKKLSWWVFCLLLLVQLLFIGAWRPFSLEGGIPGLNSLNAVFAFVFAVVAWICNTIATVAIHRIPGKWIRARIAGFVLAAAIPQVLRLLAMREDGLGPPEISYSFWTSIPATLYPVFMVVRILRCSLQRV